LPFISYGGSSLLVSAAALSVLLSVSRNGNPAVNRKVGEPAGGRAEASALLVTEAGFAPEPAGRRA
jgi:hypothetical protein